MARRTQHEAQLTREQILDAAQDLVLEKGMRCSLLQIAKTANVTRGAIYWHFHSREGLVRAVLERLDGGWRGAYADIEIDICSNPLTNLMHLAQQPLTLACSDRQLQRVVQASTRLIPCTPGSITAYTNGMKREWGRALSLGMVRDDIDVETATVGLVALTNGLLKHWVDSQREFDLLGRGKSAIHAYLEGWLPSPIRSKIAMRLTQQFMG